MKGVSMVTLTAGGIIKKVTPAVQMGKRKRPPADLDSDDEGDSDDLYDEDDDEDEEDELAAAAAHVAGSSDPSVNNGNKKKADAEADREYRPPRKLDDSTEEISGAESELNRSKRQRKEKKIFDL